MQRGLEIRRKENDNTKSRSIRSNIMIDEKRKAEKPPIILRWGEPWTVVQGKTLSNFHNKESEGNACIMIRDSRTGVERFIAICVDCMVKLAVDEYRKKKKKQ